MSKNKFTGGISGKGYYIALILCAAAIGITGYLYYRNAEDAQQLSDPTVALDVGATNHADVEAVATNPQKDPAPTQDQTEPVTQPAPQQKPAGTKKPVSGEVLAQYSMDALTYNQTTRDWRVHDGMDIAAEAGTPVTAAADGTVYTVYEDDTMGMTVVIRHQGEYTTKYSSLDQEVTVASGDTVKMGQTIGYVGSTAMLENGIGDHVHFSVSCNGALIDPADFLD